MDDFINRYVNDKIEKAMQDGYFEDLPGKGQPFNWEEWDDAFTPPERRLVNIILKNAGFAPGWITERKEILAHLEMARESLKRSWRWVQENGGLVDELAARQWVRAEETFRHAVTEINQRMYTHNLTLPDPGLALRGLDVEKEIEAIKKTREE